MITDTYKIITITYKSLDTLFNREESMTKTLHNYIARDNNYEYVYSYITQTEDKFKLNFRLRLID